MSRRIFWDTNLFVYLLEDRGAAAERVVALRQQMRARGDQLLTSALTLGELLVKPNEAGRDDLCQRYAEILHAAATIIPFDPAAAIAYARIRCDRAIRPPDAIQLACAATTGVDLFITNDERLSRKIIPGIAFLTSLARAPL
jgi:predicted nucleic acid-binding protein